MVLTEEQQTDDYLATMETGAAATEQLLFGNIASTRTAKPAGMDNNSATIITNVANVVGEYAKSVLGVTLDSSAKDYGEKLAAAYTIMKNDVTKRLLTIWTP
jgi:hypothetical protein